MSRAAGKHLIVDMGNSQYALYAHLKPYNVTLQVGDVVTEGQRFMRQEDVKKLI
jgi:hypothetical protein